MWLTVHSWFRHFLVTIEWRIQWKFWNGWMNMESKSNAQMYVCLLKPCTDLAVVGKLIHSRIVKTQTKWDVLLESCLLSMYAKCGSLKDARSIFDSMQSRWQCWFFQRGNYWSLRKNCGLTYKRRDSQNRETSYILFDRPTRVCVRRPRLIPPKILFSVSIDIILTMHAEISPLSIALPILH